MGCKTIPWSGNKPLRRSTLLTKSETRDSFWLPFSFPLKQKGVGTGVKDSVTLFSSMESSVLHPHTHPPCISGPNKGSESTKRDFLFWLNLRAQP